MSAPEKPSSITRRRLLCGLGAGSVAAALGTTGPTGPAAASTATGEILDLGVAMLSVNVRLGRTGRLPDGTPVLFAFSDGNPVSFNVLRIDTGEGLDAHQLGPDTVASSLVQHPDGTVYLSVRGPSSGRLLRYLPGSRRVEPVAMNVAGETMLRNLVVHPGTGVLYGCTYPHAKVFSYDPSTGEIRDFGSMVTDGAYAWGFDLVGDKLWIGTGIGTAHLIELDPGTGQRTEIALPDGIAGRATYINSVHTRGESVLVMFSPAIDGRNVLVFDTAARRWTDPDAVRQPVQYASVSQVDSGGRCYYLGAGELYAFDTATRSSTATGLAATPAGAHIAGTRGLGLVEAGAGAAPQLAGFLDDGTIWRFEPGTRTAETVRSTPLGSPATLHSIGVGPDGKVYTGAYLSSGVMARASTTTYEIEALRGPGQSDHIVTYRDHIIVTSYPNAVAYAGKADPWAWGSNPSELFTIGRFSEHEQDRMFDVVRVQDKLAFGSVPNYGTLGGAVILADLDGTVDVYRNVVPDQSVSALASQGSLLFGGTSVYGGLSSTPTATEAVLFGWDAQQRRKVFDLVPVPGDKIIHTLLVHGRRLWGMASTGVVFEFDIPSRTLLRAVDVGLPDSNDWGRLGNLYWRDADERLYGNAGGKLFRMDPNTLAVTVLATNAKVSTLAPTGEIFFGDSTKLYVYRP